MNPNSAQDRCTESDYRQLFSASSAELYQLCFLLTADEKLATASFAAALERAVKDATSVFREWMWSWAHRQIIKACIAALRPEIQSDARAIGCPQGSELNSCSPGRAYPLEGFTAETLKRALVGLDVLARFVFVLRNLAGYSAREIGLLLDVGPMTLESAYQRAIEVIGLEQQSSGERAGGRSERVTRRSGKPVQIGLPQRSDSRAVGILTLRCESDPSPRSGVIYAGYDRVQA